MKPRKTTRWLGRSVAAPGPYLALCLDEEELAMACKHLGANTPKFHVNGHANATCHQFTHGDKHTFIVCMRGHEKRDPIEIAGLLVHEAVHIWQAHCHWIGEHEPASEQEAYGIQYIAQELMTEYASRIA